MRRSAGVPGSPPAALVDALIAEGRSHLPADPQVAHDWFDLPCEVALRPYGSGADGVVAERALRAAGHRANALRAMGLLARLRGGMGQ